MRFTEDSTNILSLYQNTYLNDDLKLYFGSHSDVYHYYEPTNDQYYIRNANGDTIIRNEATDADIIFSNDDGSGGNANYMVIDGGAVAIDLLQDTRLKDGKKLYLDGGGNTYITQNAADTIGFSTGGSLRYTMNASGVLYVSSAVQAGNGGIQIWDGTHGFKTVLGKDSTYTKLLNNDGAVCVYLGDSGDRVNYFQADRHRFRNADGSGYFGSIDTNGLHIGTGNTVASERLEVNGNTKIYGSGNTSLFIDGAGNGHTQGQIVFRGSDDDASYRGQGTFYHDAASDIEYFAGTLYANDAWAVTRKTSTASHDTSVAQGSHALFIIEGGGDVGIGLSNPNGKLHVKDATDISMSSSGNGQLMVEGNGYTGGIALDGSNMHIYHNSGSRGLILGTNETSRYYIDGSGNHSIYGNTGFSSPMSVQYGAIFNEGGHDSDTRIESDGNANMFRVDASTNRIGIGTGSPDETLHVNGNIKIGDGNEIRIGNGNDLRFIHSSNTFMDNYTGHLYIRQHQSDHDIFFQVNDGGSTGQTVMCIDGSEQRIGIKTTSPSYDLHVAGHAYASSSFLGPDGSVGTPSYRFHNDGNTGIFLKSANYMAFSADGYERFAANGNGLDLSGGTVNKITHTAVGSRDKYRVWNSSYYTIGMDTTYTFGALNGYCMTFQMNDEDNRGWWWGHHNHSDAQGAMSLDTDGKLALAHSMRIGYGESDTTEPGASYRLDVSGSIGATADVVAYVSVSYTHLTLPTKRIV